MEKKFYLFIFAIPLLFYSCANYNKIKYRSVDFFEDKAIKKDADKYDFYVHKNSENYILKDVAFQEDSLIATIEQANENFIPAHIPDQKTPDEVKNDIHIYVYDSIQVSESSRKSIHRSEIKEIELYAKEKKGLTGLYLTLVIIGAVIVSIIAIGLIALATAIGVQAGSNASSDGSAAGSNNSSDGSNGSSDGSGCYVATMVYGSYDAPNVLILRKFRDRFLNKFNWGRKFISWYYKNSPSFVERNQNNQAINRSIRMLLNLFVAIIKPFFK